MSSPAYKACPTFVSSLHATCQWSRSCTTLPSSAGFLLGFSFSIPSCLFPVQVQFSTAYHFSSSSFSLSLHFLLLMSFSLYHNVRDALRGLTGGCIVVGLFLMLHRLSGASARGVECI